MNVMESWGEWADWQAAPLARLNFVDKKNFGSSFYFCLAPQKFAFFSSNKIIGNAEV